MVLQEIEVCLRSRKWELAGEVMNTPATGCIGDR